MNPTLVFFLAVAVCQPVMTAAEKPVALYKGLGAWHHSISTRNPQTQKFFDQGLTLAFSFNRYEALRSFQKASELDPSALMPFWGMAFAQGPYINMDGDPSFNLKGACTAVENGSKITNAPDVEKAYLKVAASWCPEFQPDTYIDAAHQLAAAYPDDLDAQTLYADSLLVRSRWHWYDATGAPAPGVPEAETVLQNVIRRWPQHPGANHLFIHAVESSPTPERAIASAQRLMGIVPWAGHMVHMPGHIWLVLGDWETAATVNERAVAVDREYFKTTGVEGGTYEPYYIHNLHFIAYARSMQGRKAQALEAANQVAAVTGEMASTMPEMADVFAALPILVHVRFNAWDAILKMPAPSEKMITTRAAWNYARTLAWAAQGNQEGAKREQAAFEEIRKNTPDTAAWGQSMAKDVMHLGSEILAARLSPNRDEACSHWRSAVDIQDHLIYDEPPDWYYPVRESLGACLLRSGKPAEATQVFREGVRRSPRNGRMLFGLHESLKAEGKSFEAESVKREFDAAWSGSDVHLRIEDL